jgi:2-polyprenyl-3-methyl-5-hydroxy-6-metoxy-1,4-benzoquinol methylase
MTVATLAETVPPTAAPPPPDGAAGQGSEQANAEAFVGRLFESALGAMDLLSVCLGDRLGLYRALAEGGPATPADLAARAGIHPRYAQEWLEQQAVTDIVAVAEDTGEATTRRYTLPASRAAALLDEESLMYLVPIARVVAGLGGLMPAVLHAYRTGGGVSFAEFGPEGPEIQAAINRPAFVNLLGSQWLPSLPDVHRRLLGDPPARIADVGCGAGWSSIAIARAYPKVRIDGYDLDGPSIELARRNATAAGVADRVSFSVQDVTDPALAERLAGSYDLVAAFEMVHDVPKPVEVLRTMRRLASEDGAVIVMDERTGEQFTAPGNPMERLFYSTSLFVCLPWGMTERSSAATGTVMRPATLRRYAQEAGFRSTEILPIEHDFFRFYRLVV